jgi:hypothetical protein
MDGAPPVKSAMSVQIFVVPMSMPTTIRSPGMFSSLHPDVARVG